MAFLGNKVDDNGVYQISGSLLNQYRNEINRLGNLIGGGGISISSGAGGTVISCNGGGGSNWRWAKFTTTEDVATYPSTDASDCHIFPAKLVPSPEYDEDDCEDDVDWNEDELGDEIVVYNKWETYIPEDVIAKVWKVNGQWYTEYARPFLRGKLDEALESGGSATMSVWCFTGAETDTGENIIIYDWFSPSTVATNTKIGAAWDQESKRYYLTVQFC